MKDLLDFIAQNPGVAITLVIFTMQGLTSVVSAWRSR